MLRFIYTIAGHLPTALYSIHKMRKAKKNLETLEEKYVVGQSVIKTVIKKSRCKVNVYGLENIPQKSGMAVFSNHQGKFDALAIFDNFPKVLKVVIDDKASHAPIVDDFLNLIEAKRLQKDNMRQGIKLFKEVEEEVKEGINYLIFPEGEWHDNKNTLQEFKTGCMKFLYRAKCPIQPVCIYDTYKVYGINSLKKVECSVHYLKPIYFEEYENLTKQELADLVKSRIQEKLDEIESNK